MKIDPNAPASDMSIRLEIATRAMQGILRGADEYKLGENFNCDDITADAYAMADAMIECANRDEPNA